MRQSSREMLEKPSLRVPRLLVGVAVAIIAVAVFARAEGAAVTITEYPASVDRTLSVRAPVEVPQTAKIAHLRHDITDYGVGVVQDRIRYWAQFYGVNENLALCLAKNESGFNPLAKNPNSSAGGTFQFINSTWISTAERMGAGFTLADKYDAEKNIQAGVWLLKTDGAGHWVVSPKCV